MDVSNSTGQNTGYRVLGSGGHIPRQRARLSTFGTPEAMQEDLRAEQDIREGRYETFSSVEEFARQLPHRLQRIREERLILAGELPPGGEAESPAPVSGFEPFHVVFQVEGREVASATFFKEPTVVRLVEDEWGFRVEADHEHGRLRA
ncbi:MAG TPA: hypothetical protein VEW48_07235 [Thermoanaerobaculia bacterium]|nr:hypothetical protein [Thermoanaerobaculia bacterium]